MPDLQLDYERSRRRHEPLIFPVFLQEPDYDCESDCFFCGDSLRACPIFDEGGVSASVKLPLSEMGWLLRGKGEPLPGGLALTVPCLPDDEPIWFLRAGEQI